ncbi:MucB/RseB C-terminal domain-containing protein [Sphaerotilus mobilis]|uniref:MucB/RseB-like sigma(E) regulatory protein n=1 Tax=Sphaerotilus mobilis TaxID=47994 RepID=A0A4Q7LAD2_9BURK|nr:MucB/RseB C-terminal domain-containing protein [Sphaerotilus mobilis]RZS47448.1 MucB/RseB-like sigma(E) regulatory protein [Sphaerotilus mobilis]
MTASRVDRVEARRLARALGFGAAAGVVMFATLALAPRAMAAGPGPTVALTTISDPAALVRRIQEAAARNSYSGTFVVGSGSQVTSLRVTHVGHGNDQIDRIEALDGELRQVYRHNDRVHVLWPRLHAALVEQRDPGLNLPGQLAGGSSARLDMYELQPGASDRIAGHEASVMLLRPRDQLRHAQKLWLDAATGLLLRTDILDEHGRVLESAGFSELRWIQRPAAQALLSEMHRLKGYRVERPAVVPTELSREGWGLSQPIAGFQVSYAVKHPPGLGSSPAQGAAMPADHATSSARPAREVLQAVFSDGLTTVSLFVEPHDGARHGNAEKASQQGATQLLGLRQGDWWITAVGDVPRATLQAFATRLERRRTP